MSNTSNEEKDQALFLHLVMMLSASALQQMGKTINPATGKTEVNLDGAAFAIDMLFMIDARTTGNLTKDESKVLQSQLATLRLNFFETTEQSKRNNASPTGDKPPAPAAAQPAPNAGGHTTPPAAVTTDETNPATDQPPTVPPSAGNAADDKTPRYHKSYG